MLINIVALEMLGAKMPKPTGEEDDDDDDVNGDDGEEDDDDKIIKMLRMATIMSQQSQTHTSFLCLQHFWEESTAGVYESFYKTSETSRATQFIGRLLKRLTSHSVS